MQCQVATDDCGRKAEGAENLASHVSFSLVRNLSKLSSEGQVEKRREKSGKNDCFHMWEGVDGLSCIVYERILEVVRESRIEWEREHSYGAPDNAEGGVCSFHKQLSVGKRSQCSLGEIRFLTQRTKCKTNPPFERDVIQEHMGNVLMPSGCVRRSVEELACR